MSTKALKQEAVEIANDIQGRALAAKKELAEVQDRKAALEAQIEAASLSAQRAKSFNPSLGGDFQCPRCWINNEVQSPLVPLPGSEDEDFFECKTCGFHFSIPA